MLRFLLAACLLVAAAPAAAQSTMLVPRPPVYQPGESAQGVLIDQTGAQMELRQQAQFGSDGKLYVMMTIAEQNGTVRARIVFDPLTWSTQAVSDTEVTKTISTTCSADKLYPITLGKRYECTSVLQVNDRVLNTRTRMHFRVIHADPAGRLLGFCALVEDDDGGMTITTLVCSSPDGKWVQSIRVVKVVERQKT